MYDLVNMFKPLLRQVQVDDEESESLWSAFLTSDERIRPTERFQFGEKTSFALVSNQVAKVVT